MGTVTYPDANVANKINEEFVALQINLLDKHPDFKEASGAGRVIFAPTFLFTDAKGREIRRYLGWLPPESFLGELEFVRGMHAFNTGQFLPARDHFAAVLDKHGDADVAAESLYWQGIAGFLGGNRDGEALAAAWNGVRERFPDSTWATRAAPIEDA